MGTWHVSRNRKKPCGRTPGNGGWRKGREEVGEEARWLGLPCCGKELGVLNYDRKPMEGYVEEQADSIFKRFLCRLCGRRIYTIDRSGSQESSEEEVVVMTLVVLS